MEKILGTGRTLAVGAVALLVAGCSGEPSAADIKQAIRNNKAMMMQIEMALQGGSVRGGGPRMTTEELLTDTDVEKGGCASANGAPGFICDFRLTIYANGQSKTGQWGKGRFFNADGWQVEVVR